MIPQTRLLRTTPRAIALWIALTALANPAAHTATCSGGAGTDTKALNPNIPWKELIGMRHILVHDYFIVN